MTLKKNLSLKKTTLLNHFRAKKKGANLILLSKTRFFQRVPKITLARLFLWKRMTHKKTILVQRKKIKLKKKDLFYRAAYRQDYRKFLYLSTGVKLTYLIEDLVRKYFTLRVKIKIC